MTAHARKAPLRWTDGIMMLIVSVFAAASPLPAAAEPASPQLSSQFPPFLPEARGDHTATVLASGKVLIAGGNNEAGKVASTLLYDSVANTWTTVGNLATPRFLHTATLLANGKVLVAGGTNGTILASAEIFDPSTNKWTAAAPMPTARYAHTTTRLANGKVLVVGGTTLGGAAATAEIYDAERNAWIRVADALVPRASHTATLLPSGRVLVVGGRNAEGSTGAVEFYDPTSNFWTSGPVMADARADHTATLLQDGSVLVVGGQGNGKDVLASAARYFPGNGSWARAGVLRNARKLHTATLLSSGKVEVVGGYPYDTQATVEQFDPVANAWRQAAGLPNSTLRWGHTAVLLPNGTVLVAGGARPNAGYSHTVYVPDTAVYDSDADDWTAQWSLLKSRSGHSVTLLASGKVLIAGGRAVDGSPVASTEIYDPGTHTSSAGPSMTVPRAGHSATRLADGKVLVIGGCPMTLEFYDPKANAWQALGKVPSSPATPCDTFAVTVPLPGSRLLVLSGAIFGTETFSYYAWVYDFSTDRWTSVAPWEGGLLPTATLLPTGKVLVAGGFSCYYFSPGCATARAGIFDPKSLSWQPAANMPMPRSDGRAVALANGQVLIAGGWRAVLTRIYDPRSPLPPVLYDVAGDRWHWQRSAAVPRKGDYTTELSLWLLPSGEVLMLDGTPDPAVYPEGNYLYDPLTNDWSAAADSSSGPSVLLPSGRVLITGAGQSADVELYDP